LFGRREEARRWVAEVIEKFRQKGAVSADRAMSVEELGLPFGFEEAMKRRLGRSGIFVEVGGKYYLNEARLKEIEEQRRGGGGAAWGSRGRLFMLRVVRLVVAFVAVVLLLASFFVLSWELRVVAVVCMGVWLAISVLQIYYLSRVRRRL
jgi:hypothetical protein